MMRNFSIPALALFVIFIQQSHAGPGYSLKIMATTTNGEQSVVEAPSLKFFGKDGYAVVPAPGSPWKISFDFDLSEDEVRVEVHDLSNSIVTNEGRVSHAELFSGHLVFIVGEETTIMTSDLGKLSFLLTPPTEELKTEKEKKSLRTEFSKEEMKLIESTFSYNSSRARGVIYNQTSRKITEVHLRTKSSDGEINRVYKKRITVESLTEEHCQIDMNLPALPEGVEYEVTLEKVFE